MVARLVIGAPASGHGKTSVATGLLAAFRARGLTVSPHKVGPDYIDPGYHALAAGRPGRNLDPWLVGEDLIVPLFEHGARTPTPAGIAIVEGVMGLFDGATGMGSFASTAHVAGLLRAPVVLVVDATAMGRSAAALVHGFTTFDPNVRIGAVILNRVGTSRHERILRDAMDEAGVAVLVAIPRRAELATPSRHLGLIPAAERSEVAQATVAALGAVIADSVDLDALLTLARSAGELPASAVNLPPLTATQRPTVRVAIAGGPAFTFGYAEQAELLAGAGAEIVIFDPLYDDALPDGIDGIVIGGGFPEAHAAALSKNETLRADIVAAASLGMPIAAECAGLLYLAQSLDGHRMCGVVDVDAQMTDRLTLGYREAVAVTESVLLAEGTRVHGHEFHRTTCDESVAPAAWQWQTDAGVVRDGIVLSNVHASYLHLHWAGVPGIADRFVAACARRREWQLAR